MKSAWSPALMLVAISLLLSNAGCNGLVQSNSIPAESLTSRPSGAAQDATRNAAAAGLKVDVVQMRSSPQIVRHFSVREAKAPVGSSVYYYGAYVLQDGAITAAVSQNATFQRVGGSVVVTDTDGFKRPFSANVSVSWQADAGEFIVKPHGKLSKLQRQLVNSGAARFAKSVARERETESEDTGDDYSDYDTTDLDMGYDSNFDNSYDSTSGDVFYVTYSTCGGAGSSYSGSIQKATAVCTADWSQLRVYVNYTLPAGAGYPATKATMCFPYYCSYITPSGAGAQPQFVSIFMPTPVGTSPVNLGLLYSSGPSPSIGSAWWPGLN